MVGAVGDDVFAATARQTLAAAGVDVGGLITSPGATGAAVVAVDGRGENQIIVASGANGRVSLAQVEALDFGAVTTLLLQMEIPRAVVEAAIDRAAAAGVRVVLNLAPAAPLDPARLSRVDVLIANRGEADSLVPEADDALQQACCNKPFGRPPWSIGGGDIGRRWRGRRRRRRPRLAGRGATGDGD